MKKPLGWRLRSSCAAGMVQIMSPMPVQREKTTGRRPVRKMVGIKTLRTYLKAAQCRVSRLGEFDFFGGSADTRAVLWDLRSGFTSQGAPTDKNDWHPPLNEVIWH